MVAKSPRPVTELTPLRAFFSLTVPGLKVLEIFTMSSNGGPSFAPGRRAFGLKADPALDGGAAMAAPQ